MSAIKELERVEQKRKALNAQLSALDKQREVLRKTARKERAEKLGLMPGTRYRVIPADQAGDIMEGTFRKLSFGRWGDDEAYAVFRLPAKNSKPERVAHFQINRFEFELVDNKKGKEQ